MAGDTAAAPRWGVLGAARIAAEQVVPAIRRADAGEVLGVSSASANIDTFADRLGIPRRFGDHDVLLADPDIDVVYIALPNSLHAPWILRAIQAGKHVLCEKPIVLDPSDLDQIAEAAERRGVLVTEAFMYRHHPQLIREAVDGGAIGALSAVHARLHFVLERSAEPDIRLRPDLGGGALWDLGCYPVDFVGELLGCEPEEVVAVGSRDEDGGVFTHVAAALRYGSVTVGLDCGFDGQMTGTATLIGSSGSITATDVSRADLAGGVGTIVVQSGPDRRVLTASGDHDAEQARAVVRHIRAGSQGMAAGDLTVRTTRTLTRIHAALQQGG